MANEKQIPRNKVERFQSVLARKHVKVKHDNDYDMRLVHEYRDGDEEAGWELFESYADELSKIYRFPSKPPRKVSARRKGHYSPMTYEDKEDLVQEIALHFFALVDEYDMNRPFENMLRSKLHNRVFDNFYADLIDIQVNETEFNEDEQEKFEQKAQDVLLDEDKQAKIPESHIRLYQAFNGLAPRQREVVEMSIIKGWNSTEIAEETGIKPATVRVTLKKALEKLKELMKEEGQ